VGAPDEVADCHGLVVPGVGAFDACMDQLLAAGADQLIRSRVETGQPVLGICVGHQIMFSSGTERGRHREGLGLLPGEVVRMQCERLPHMGWNTITSPGDSTLFTTPAERFYFVHSCAVRAVAPTPGIRISWTQHDGEKVVAAVEAGALTSVQFHPEKSGAAGLSLLRRWVERLDDPGRAWATTPIG